MHQEKEEVLTIKEVMLRLKITRPTVIKLLREEKLKAIKVGRNYRVLESSLNKFLKGPIDF